MIRKLLWQLGLLAGLWLFALPAWADDVIIRLREDGVGLLKSPQYDAEVVRTAAAGEEFVAVTTVNGEFYLVKDEVEGGFFYVPFVVAEEIGVPLPENIQISGRMPMPDQMDLSYWQVAPGDWEEDYDELKLRSDGDQQMLTAANGKKYPASYEYNQTYRPRVNGAQLVRDAKVYLGTPYVLGGTTTSGIDCSGLTLVCLAKQGIDVVHRSSLQALHGRYIESENLRAGDLVFFRDKTDSRYLSHVGIYIGGGRFIHASQSIGGVAISNLSDEYFKSHYGFARRF